MPQQIPIDPDKGVTDLVRQLVDDSRRLVQGEVRLAKMETGESMKSAGKGALWLGVAFGAAVVMLVAFTLFFATLFGRIANDHMWVGAMLTAALEIALGLWLVQRGSHAFKAAPYSLPQTREAMKVIRAD